MKAKEIRRFTQMPLECMGVTLAELEIQCLTEEPEWFVKHDTMSQIVMSQFWHRELKDVKVKPFAWIFTNETIT
jgi:hypothetical protein